jgi:L-alanine-DL-glutamate epimerase-like enolase superfamily enzyme
MQTLLEMLDAVRSTFGREVGLSLDCHGRLSPAEAIWLCREAEQFDLYYVEDPLRAEYIGGYHHLRRHVNVPLAAGEQFSSKWEFRELIENDLIDFARIDLAICAGLSEAKKIAGWCETHHIQVAPHNPLGPINLASDLHLLLAINNAARLEVPWVPGTQLPDIFSVDLPFENGALGVPTRPGLGIEFDENKARAHGYVKTEPPHFHRLDGSFTNY